MSTHDRALSLPADLAQARSPELEVLESMLSRASLNPASRKEYARDLRGFAAWCEAEGLPLFEVRRQDAERWVSELLLLGIAPRTIRRRLAAVQQFYLEAVDLEKAVRVPTMRVVRPRVDEDQKLGLDREDCRRLLAAAEAAGHREEALVCLLLLNGLRVSEAASLTVASLDQERGHDVIRFLRKGGKKRVAALAPRTRAAIDAYLATRSDLDPHAPLILGAAGGRLSRFAGARVTYRLGRAAGIKQRVHPHELRHAFITQGLDAGVTQRDMQVAAGHSDPRMTAAYDRARRNLDRHPTYAVASWLAAA